MNSKSVEYFQQDQLNDNIPIPSIDSTYLAFNRAIKYMLNFLLIYYNLDMKYQM